MRNSVSKLWGFAMRCQSVFVASLKQHVINYHEIVFYLMTRFWLQYVLPLIQLTYTLSIGGLDDFFTLVVMGMISVVHVGRGVITISTVVALFSISSFRCRSIHPTRLHANSACGVRWCPWSGVHKLQGEMIGQQGVVQTFADKNWMVQLLTPKCQKNREMRTWFWHMKPSTWDATPTNAILCMFERVLWVTTNTQHFGSLHLITYLMGAHEMAKRRKQGIG